MLGVGRESDLFNMLFARSARRTPEIGVSFFREGDAWKQVPGFAPE